MIRRKAFTLIELLVVVAIITILLALSVPVLRRARSQARAAACQMNLRQWATALATIMEDNEGRFPHNESVPHEALTALWILTGRSVEEKTNGALQAPRKYHALSTKGMLCPEASRPADDFTADTLGGGSGTWSSGGTSWEYDIKGGGARWAWVLTLHGGPATDDVRVSCSYGFNGWLFQRPGGPSTPRERFEAARSSEESYTNFFTLRNTARVPVLLDCTYYSGSPTNEDLPPLAERDRIAAVGGPMGRFYIDRHSEHINCLFFDWSVRKIGLKELLMLKWYEGFDAAGRRYTSSGAP